MDTNAFRVDIDITTWPHQSRLSSLNEVLIFINGHVEKFLQDEASGTVISSLGSKPDPSFRDHRHSLDFENFRPDYVFQRLGKELHNCVLSRLISDHILATSQRTYLPKGRPLFMMVNVELTRKEYLAAPSIEESVVEEPPSVEENVVEESPSREESFVEEPPSIEESVPQESVVEEPPSTEESVVEEPPSIEESVVEEPHDLETEDTCAICLEGIFTESKNTKLPCDHPFHEDCITKWIYQNYNTCPLCRQHVKKKSYIWFRNC